MGTSIRPTGVDHAAAALRNLERKQDVIANNLANVSTTGFKGELVFAHLLDAGAPATVGTTTDMRAGTLMTTGNSLDIAMEKDGFFVVQTPDGERWARSGSLSVNEAHQLVDPVGNPLLAEDDPQGGTRGPIRINDNVAELHIDKSGAVIADGVQVGRLRIEHTTSAAHIDHEGNGLFKPTADRERVANDARGVRQGALEESNVQSLDSLVDLISVQRAYASVQKVLTTIDAAATMAATQIGKPV